MLVLARGFFALTGVIALIAVSAFAAESRYVSSVSVLVVEDSEPFRQYVCSALKKRIGLQIVGKVSDELEAVQKAKELLRDLILLDVGLPTLGGIEVARRIRELSIADRR